MLLAQSLKAIISSLPAHSCTSSAHRAIFSTSSIRDHKIRHGQTSPRTEICLQTGPQSCLTRLSHARKLGASWHPIYGQRGSKMFRAIGSPAALVATTVDSGTQRRYCVRGFAISGQDTHGRKTPALCSSRAASWNLPGLARQDDDISLQMSLGFQFRNHPRLRSFRHAAQAPSGSGGSHGADGFGKVVSSVWKMLRKIGEAFALQEYDILDFKRRGSVKVPRGHCVSEREWAELDADRKVEFSPRVGAFLIPTRGESYPTPARTAACFFSDRDMVEESKHISAGDGIAEWKALLAETRRDAAKARKKEVQARLRKKLQQEQKAQIAEARNFFGFCCVFPS